MLRCDVHDGIATIALNDPRRRNALGVAMFDALDAVLIRLGAMDDVAVVLLRGEGPAFCAGFDLAAAVDDPPLMGTLIHRLSGVLRGLRRLPHVVVAAVHGSAIAGGCALVSACDVVVISSAARLGYPVHRLGISPAVTIPTLCQAVSPGSARALVMVGELIDGSVAHRIGLAHRLSADDASVLDDAQRLCRTIATHGHQALRVTKDWVNVLDGSVDDARFTRPAEDSAALAGDLEARELLAIFWGASRA